MAGVQTGSSIGEQPFIGVSREKVEFAPLFGPFRRFYERHCNRIGFLTRRAADHPEADRLAARLLDEFGKNFPFEHLEGLWVAEKTGQVDEHVRIKRLQLLV